MKQPCIFLLFAQLLLISVNTTAQIFFENFSSGDLGQFTYNDNDNDGYNWFATDYNTGNGEGFVATSASWESGVGPLNPDNWLISPIIDLSSYSGIIQLSWNVYAQDQDWVNENYSIYISYGNTINDFLSGSPVFSEVLTTSQGYMSRSVDITNYSGNAIYFAFRHHDVTDNYRFNIDNVEVKEISNDYTFIPDQNFEQALIDLGYDDVIDAQVLTTNISSLTILDVSSNNISDLTGIQAFASLTNLSCQYNQLSLIDLSQNINLITLSCNHNQLSLLDLSQNVNLSELNCYNNQIENLELTQNSNLTNLNCNFNQLSELDLSSNILLGQLYCANNSINSLNLGQNASIIYLQCQNNQLKNLNVSQISSLILLNCGGNQIANLDLSSNPSLITLKCDNNQLLCMNLGNGNNNNFNEITAQENVELLCVEVDDPSYSNSNWTGSNFTYSSSITFELDCNYSSCLANVCDTTIITLDTTFTDIFDTTFTEVFDTTFTDIFDTTFTEVFDTTFTELFDTTFTEVFDTIYTEIFDTTYLSIGVTDTLYIDIELSGVSEINNLIKIYPNPASNYVIIDNGDYNLLSDFRLVIFNGLFQQVFSRQIDAQQFIIPISDLGAEGMYFVQIFDQNNSLLLTKYLVFN